MPLDRALQAPPFVTGRAVKIKQCDMKAIGAQTAKLEHVPPNDIESQTKGIPDDCLWLWLGDSPGPLSWAKLTMLRHVRGEGETKQVSPRNTGDYPRAQAHRLGFYRVALPGCLVPLELRKKGVP